MCTSYNMKFARCISHQFAIYVLFINLICTPSQKYFTSMAYSLYEEAFLFLISLYMKGNKIGIFPLLITEGAVRDAFMWSHVHLSY